jgi:phage shock protein PspC (stress-responsive transcriptional regulator)
MSSTPSPTNTSTRPPLTRSTTDKKIAGVSAGLARHLGIDPVLVRIGFVVTAVCTGVGLLAYAAMWAFVPKDDETFTDAGTPARPVAA